MLWRHQIAYKEHPELLTPTTIYYPQIKTLMDEIPILGMSHITGGGIPENLPRCIPEGLTPVVDYSSWERPEIFNVIQKGAQCTEDDMKSTFNLGIGFCLIVPQEVDDLDENLIGEIHG